MNGFHIEGLREIELEPVTAPVILDIDNAENEAAREILLMLEERESNVQLLKTLGVASGALLGTCVAIGVIATAPAEMPETVKFGIMSSTLAGFPLMIIIIARIESKPIWASILGLLTTLAVVGFLAKNDGLAILILAVTYIFLGARAYSTAFRSALYPG